MTRCTPSQPATGERREWFAKGTNLRRGDCPGIPLEPIRKAFMGKGIILWLLGIPLPIIILIVLFWH